MERLNLSRNKLSQLPREVFSGLSSLGYLHLSGNKLRELPEGIFSGLTALEMLELKSNKLRRSVRKAIRQTIVKDCRILF